jgi:hypothetical protein
MIKCFGLILITVCFAVSPGFGQAGVKIGDPILFRGVVIDASSQSRLSNSQITINKAVVAVTNVDGAFSFYVYRRDTVIFSMLGYKPTTLFVSDTLTGKEFLAGVYLETDTLSIGEVVILPRLTSLKAEMMNGRIEPDTRLDNARNNISIASYQGRTGQGKLGDPGTNYELLRHKQKINAYEKGGIPSDRIVGLSPLLLIPAAYLLVHGLPEKPAPPKPNISSRDLDELQKKYLETLKNRK